MLYPISSITRAATRKPDEPLNIICNPTHESYETNLCKTGHNFYAVRHPSVKDWDTKYRQVPSNYTLLNPDLEQHQIPTDISFDLVLSQNKFGQYQILRQYADQLHLPMVSLEHTLPVPNWPDTKKLELKSARGDTNVFISEFSRKEWMWDEDEAEVIHHGVDTALFCPNTILVDKKNHALSVVNDWINRDWCCGYRLWQEAMRELPTVVVGNTPGLSEPAKSVHELVRFYRQAMVFVNTSLISPVPSVVLEAMACGLPIVSTDTAMLPEVITHGINGFLCKDVREIREYTQLLLADPVRCKFMGVEARKTVLEKFSLKTFVANWDKTLRKTAEIIYK